MDFISTRGSEQRVDFSEMLLSGLADDGGLFVPGSIPHFSEEAILSMRGKTYAEIVCYIVECFGGETFAKNRLKELAGQSYAGFNHASIIPCVELADNFRVAELFHGPTLAFKDFAMQLLGRMINELLHQKNEYGISLCATSGDTGSAAIAGCRHSRRINCVVLHPHKRISEVQRRQMTTVRADNIHNVAFENDFDGCLALIKNYLRKAPVPVAGVRHIALNSINFGRVIAQTAYYFYCALPFIGQGKDIVFSVPSGNFGNAYAGYLASRMGLPIKKILVACNENDVLHRFFEQNKFEKKPLIRTLSPSMDIALPASFERLLFDLYDRDGISVDSEMRKIERNESVSLPDRQWQNLSGFFKSYRCSDDQTLEIIQSVYAKTGYVADPHTANALFAAECFQKENSGCSLITLATAHPAKFPEVFMHAGIAPSNITNMLEQLRYKPERYTLLEDSGQEKNTEALQWLISGKLFFDL